MELLGDRPELVLELWAAAEPDLRALIEQDWIARVQSGDIRVVTSRGVDRPRGVDLVVTLHLANIRDGPPKIVLVIECQLNPDQYKFYVWFEYLAGMRRRHQCGGRLVVISPLDWIIQWTHTLFDEEPWSRPALIGRDQVPFVDDHGLALRMPELAVLSAVFHGPHERGEQVVSAAALALRVLPRHRRENYIMLLKAALSGEIMAEIHTMTFEEAQAASDEFQQTRAGYVRAVQAGHAAGRAAGLLDGHRRALALVFELRGLTPTAAEQARIDTCAALDQVYVWCERAKTADRVADIFD